MAYSFANKPFNTTPPAWHRMTTHAAKPRGAHAVRRAALIARACREIETAATPPTSTVWPRMLA